MDGKEVGNGMDDWTKASVNEGNYGEQPLITALRLFVKFSGLRVPRVAQLMGVGEATLSKWLAGTVRPTQKKLQQIESFLVWHGREYLTNPGQYEETSS
jgi:hypothetical protein